MKNNQPSVEPVKPDSTQIPSLTIEPPIIDLEADGDFNTESELLTRLSNKNPVRINDGYFHLELIEVDETGAAVNSSLQENIDAVWTLCGARPAAMKHNGKLYVAVLFPHQE